MCARRGAFSTMARGPLAPAMDTSRLSALGQVLQGAGLVRGHECSRSPGAPPTFLALQPPQREP